MRMLQWTCDILREIGSGMSNIRDKMKVTLVKDKMREV